jgi:hypothetical protein
MHTIYLLSSRKLDLINFDFINKIKKCRIVILDKQCHIDNLSESIKGNIDSVYCVDGVELPSNKIISDCLPLNFDSSLATIRADIEKYSVNEFSVFTFWDNHVELSIQLNEALGISDIANCKSSAFKNKLEMKKLVSSVNLRIPHFCRLEQVSAGDSPQYYNTLVATLGTPFIIKPIDGSGSYRVYKIESYSDFELFLTDTSDCYYHYEAEEFIAGTMFHCDFVIQQEHIIYEACGQYFCPVMECKKGEVFGSVMLPPGSSMAAAALSFASKCLQPFQIKNGAVHMEIFFSPLKNEFVFLELGFRPPGIEHMSRVATPNLHTLSLAARITTDKIVFEFIGAQEVSAWGWIPPKYSGVVSAIVPPKLDSMNHFAAHVKVGDEIKLDKILFKTLFDFRLLSTNADQIFADIDKIKKGNIVTLDPSVD